MDLYIKYIEMAGKLLGIGWGISNLCCSKPGHSWQEPFFVFVHVSFCERYVFICFFYKKQLSFLYYEDFLLIHLVLWTWVATIYRIVMFPYWPKTATPPGGVGVWCKPAWMLWTYFGREDSTKTQLHCNYFHVSLSQAHKASRPRNQTELFPHPLSLV